MPSAEVRYIAMIGDYILDIMPESNRRRRLVLAYITERIMVVPSRGRRLALAAVIAIASSAVTVAADNIWEAHARIGEHFVRVVQNETGTMSLVYVREPVGGPVVVLRREPLTGEEARALLSDPQWAAKALSRLAKGA
jgi:hypothetical protein